MPLSVERGFGRNRRPYYLRIRSSFDCIQTIKSFKTTGPQFVPEPQAAFEIGPEWDDPPDGIIQMPPADWPAVDSHAVRMIDFENDQSRLVLQNSWGEWGQHGLAQMPVEYFDRRLIESWAEGLIPDFQLKGRGQGPGIQPISWEARGLQGELLQVLEIYDRSADERIAWTFLLLRNDGIHIEDLYVRPEFRGRGHGAHLVRMIRDFVRNKGHKLHLWVPFADSREQNPGNVVPLTKIAHRLGLSFHKVPVRWAAYLATPEAGSEEPVEPDHVPNRPKSAREKVRAAAIALGLTFGMGAPQDPPAQPHNAPAAHKDQAEHHHPPLGNHHPSACSPERRHQPSVAGEMERLVSTACIRLNKAHRRMFCQSGPRPAGAPRHRHR